MVRRLKGIGSSTLLRSQPQGPSPEDTNFGLHFCGWEFLERTRTVGVRWNLREVFTGKNLNPRGPVGKIMTNTPFLSKQPKGSIKITPQHMFHPTFVPIFGSLLPESVQLTTKKPHVSGFFRGNLEICVFFLGGCYALDHELAWPLESRKCCVCFFESFSIYSYISFPPQETHQFLAQETNQPKKGYQQRHRRWEIPIQGFCWLWRRTNSDGWMDEDGYNVRPINPITDPWDDLYIYLQTFGWCLWVFM